jgi:hypothetical protein
MTCEMVKDHIVLLNYGELPDDLAVPLEQHLADCAECRSELEQFQLFEEQMATLPVLEPSPNLLAQSRMQLDDALDMMQPHGLVTRFRSNFYRWLGHIQGAPALATLLLGVGFLAGNFTYRYQVAHTPKPQAPVIIHEPHSIVANVTGITQTPDSELVQVHYNRIVPETMEGSLDSPEIRQLLLVGANSAATDGVRLHSVSLLTRECMAGHSCQLTPEGNDIRHALMVSLRYDHDSGVRMKALEGLGRYVEQDQHVRDAVLEAVVHDSDPDVRQAAIGVLDSVHSDSSVRQVLRTVATQDANPYIRTASYNVLQSGGDIQ